MKTQTDKTQESQNSITPRVSQEPGNGGTAQLKDHRTSTIDQRQLQRSMHSAGNEKPVQKKNKTGLPDNLKSGIENLSGYSMDDVKIHYNSSKPAQLQAHAYAQGTDIHLAPGQEKHLPHEAWHVVQQKQGRVQPTTQLKGKVYINDDTRLEKEADVMGSKALQMKSFSKKRKFSGLVSQVVQREVIPDLSDEASINGSGLMTEDIFTGLENREDSNEYGSEVNNRFSPIIRCRIYKRLTLQEAQAELRGADVVKEKYRFQRIGNSSMNKTTYRIINQPWVALVAVKSVNRLNLQGIQTRESKLNEEMDILEELSKSVDTPVIGDHTLIDCTKNGKEAVGVIQELMEGEELDKKLGNKEQVNFFNEITADINKQTTLDDKFKRYFSILDSIIKLHQYIVVNKKDIPDFQLFYQSTTGKLLVFDPGVGAMAFESTRSSRARSFVKWLYKEIKKFKVK